MLRHTNLRRFEKLVKRKEMRKNLFRFVNKKNEICSDLKKNKKRKEINEFEMEKKKS